MSFDGCPRTREAKNLLRNWGKALKETYTHVCKTAKRVGKQAVNFSKTIDWKKVVSVSAYIAGEFLSVNDVYRLVTGKDPLTGEKASRLEAAAWLTLDVLTLGGSKAGKVAKVATKANKLVDVVKGSKVVSRVNKTVDVVKSSKAVSKANKVIDSGKAYLKSGANKLLDTPLPLSPRLATAGGSAMNMGGTTLREAGQNVKKGFDNFVQAFAKNGDEVGKTVGSGSKNTGTAIPDPTFKSNYDIPKNSKGYTKSNLKLGQGVHKEYKANDVLKGYKEKEYRLPSGKRADFIDFENNIVYELKPNNQNQIRKGTKQLQGYVDELISETGEQWTGILDTY